MCMCVHACTHITCFRWWENAGVILLRTAHHFVCSRNSSLVYHRVCWLIDSPCSTAPCPQHHQTLLLVAILLTLQGLLLPLLLLLHQRHAFSVPPIAVGIPGLRFVVLFRPQDASENIRASYCFVKVFWVSMNLYVSSTETQVRTSRSSYCFVKVFLVNVNLCVISKDTSENIQIFILFCKSLLSQHESLCQQYRDTSENIQIFLLFCKSLLSQHESLCQQ
jgi:hypothetical protein